MDGTIVTLFAVIVAMLIYFLSIHRDIQRIKDKHEAALREVKDARREFGEIRKELSGLIAEFTRAQKNNSDAIDGEVKWCKEKIERLHRRLSFVEEHYEIHPMVLPPGIEQKAGKL